MPAAASERSFDEFLEFALGAAGRDVDELLRRYEHVEPGVRRRMEFVAEALRQERRDADGAVEDPPDRIGRYTDVTPWTAGGMGLVYRARDVELDRDVVVKTVQSRGVDREVALERLRREARLASRVDDEGICPILDVVSDGDEVYVVMPFLEGRTLATWIQEEARSSPLPRRVELVARIARAVELAHAAGVIHRDLKPGNVMVRSDSRPVVLDFGLALDVADERSDRLTRSGDLIGTPLYMAPEQIDAAHGGIDARTDVHALGVVLYEMLTLVHPFAAERREGVYRNVLAGEPRRPRRHAPAIGRDLEAVCLKAMSPSAADRYSSAAELADDLERVLGREPTRARPVSAWTVAWRRARRAPRAAAAAALVVLLAGAAVYLGDALRGSQAEAEDLAEDLELDRMVLDAILEGELPEDPSRLREVLGAELLQEVERGELEPRVWLERLVRYQDEHRGGLGSPDLLLPRGAVVEANPRFVFRVPSIGDGPWSFLLRIEGDGQERLLDVASTATGNSEVEVVLPPPSLRPDTSYRWSVVLDPGRHPEDAALFLPEPARFRVVPPDTRDAILAWSPTGSTRLDVILRALQLVRADLAAAAAAILEPLADARDRRERTLRALVSAEAAVRRGLSHDLRELERQLLGNE